MDSPATSWLTEMGLDNSIFMDQCDFMDSFDEDIVAVIHQDLENCLSSEPPQTGPEPPGKPHKPNNSSAIQSPPNPEIRASSSPIILNFGNANSPESTHRQPLNPAEEAAVSQVLRSKDHSIADDRERQLKRAQPGKKMGRVRETSQTYDHIIAERKRREQLSERFAVLSTIVPDLKKMDKSSVLGDAIKYLKHLQERVKILEEQARKQPMESVVFVKKSQITAEDEGSSDERNASSDELPLPEIEARLCNNLVLLRVHCEKQKGVLVKLLSKVEKLNLAVLNTNIAIFGSLSLDITIVAEMEKEFKLTMQQVVKSLREALAPSYGVNRNSL